MDSETLLTLIKAAKDVVRQGGFFLSVIFTVFPK